MRCKIKEEKKHCPCFTHEGLRSRVIRLQEQEAENEDSGPDVNFKRILEVMISCCTIVLPLIIQCGELFNILKTKGLVTLDAHLWI